MAKVYKGKVVIPGHKLDEFIKLMAAAERQRAPFREHLTALRLAFYDHLVDRFSERTARKHGCVVELFIDFLCRYTDVQDISEITRGMVRTEFAKWWKRKVWDSTSPNDLRVALKKFFRFLAAEKGIVNETVLKALA